MKSIERSIEVESPVHALYSQWLTFEEFPLFMERVRSITELDDGLLRWEVDIDGELKKWNATVTEQVPDTRVAWESEAGEYIVAVVSLEPLDAIVPGLPPL